MTTININEVFNALDARRVAAQAIVAQYTPAQVAEARRVALLYDRCATTSVKHAEDTARQLRELFGAPEKTMEFSPADYYTQDVFSRHGDAVLMTTTDTQDGFAPYYLTIIEGCPSSVHGLHYLVAHGGVVERTVFKSVAAAKTYAVDWYMGHREKVAV